MAKSNRVILSLLSLLCLTGLGGCTGSGSKTTSTGDALQGLPAPAAGIKTVEPAVALRSDERAGLTDLELTPDSCIQRLESSQQQTYPSHYVLPGKVSLISWNIYKAQHQNLASDLAHLNSSADIVLLQEALLNKDLVGLKPFWRFAPGYKSGDQQSGVLTLSRWPATVHCHFVHQEPWLRTPKATNVVEYVMNDGQRLLAINLHAINFSLGLTDYRRQLDDAITIIEHHKGPVVFAGDLNSWSLRRGDLLDERLKSVGLEAASFSQDNRTRFWGRPLDYVWVRGININSAEVPISTSSDHNPLLVSFDLSPAQPYTDKGSIATADQIHPETSTDFKELLDVIEN